MYELVKNQLHAVKDELPDGVELVAISKYHPAEAIAAAYEEGQRIFGESHEQELSRKHATLPQDIEWHFIGHLQTNKVRQLLPNVSMIHSVDSLKLLQCINKEAARIGKIVNVLLQVHVAQEQEKFGFSVDELEQIASGTDDLAMSNVRICGLMAMATNTDDEAEIRSEFARAHAVFEHLKHGAFSGNSSFCELSMGMSDDYPIAVDEGSTMVRIGTTIFGEREY